MSKISFKVEAVRTLSSPYQKNSKSTEQFETIYYLLVNTKELPEGIPLDVNPREPKMTTNVAHRLMDAVTNDEKFYLNNRGIVIAAKTLTFNTSDSMVTIDLGDQDKEDDRFLYGILDGGHTYTAIMEKRDKIPSGMEQYVRMEVITNVNNISSLSDARNTSVQVSDMALFNLDDKFEPIKEAIKGQVYADDIAYKDNEDKKIHVSELLRLMYAFDIDRFPDTNKASSAPVQSYSGKAQVFKRYKEVYDDNAGAEAKSFYDALIGQIPKLVELYETIEADLANKYCDYKKANGVSTPKFGNVRGIETLDKPCKSGFLGRKIDYAISAGYIYPIFGAFRNLIEFDTEKQQIEWAFDPIEIWHEVGSSLAQNTFESSNNPQLAGKDKNLWLSNYRIVRMQKLEKTLEKK